MKTDKQFKSYYSAPWVQVVELQMRERVLGLSNVGVGLDGAGVDEEDADDNGDLIW